MAVGSANLPDTFAEVKLACSFYHQNVPAMMFRASKDQARAIVATCLNCQGYQILPVGSGVSPGALVAASYGNPMSHIFLPLAR